MYVVCRETLVSVTRVRRLFSSESANRKKKNKRKNPEPGRGSTPAKLHQLLFASSLFLSSLCCTLARGGRLYCSDVCAFFSFSLFSFPLFLFFYAFSAPLRLLASSVRGQSTANTTTHRTFLPLAASRSWAMAFDAAACLGFFSSCSFLLLPFCRAPVSFTLFPVFFSLARPLLHPFLFSHSVTRRSSLPVPALSRPFRALLSFY